MSRQRLSFGRRVMGWAHFAGFYLVEVVKSNMFILWDVLTPGDLTSPAIIAIDLPEEMSDNQVLFVSNLVTMTPGSLTLELTQDRKKLLVHILYASNLEEIRTHITKNYVHRVIELS